MSARRIRLTGLGHRKCGGFFPGAEVGSLREYGGEFGNGYIGKNMENILLDLNRLGW